VETMCDDVVLRSLGGSRHTFQRYY